MIEKPDRTAPRYRARTAWRIALTVACLLGASSLEGATAGPSCREVITGPDGLTVSCSREGVQETAGIVPQPGTWSGESGEGVFRIEIDVCSDDRFFMEGRIICLGGSDPQVLTFLTSNSASHLGERSPFFETDWLEECTSCPPCMAVTKCEPCEQPVNILIEGSLTSETRIEGTWFFQRGCYGADCSDTWSAQRFARDPMDSDEDGTPNCDDCHSRDPASFPGAPELCDGIDNDCDGDIDEDCSEGVAVSLCGNIAHHAWEVRTGGESDIAYRHCTVGGACSPVRKLVAAGTEESQPTIACEEDVVLVAWEDTRNGNPDIAFRRSMDGGNSFEPLRFLARGGGEQLDPVLVLDGDTALIAWESLRDNIVARRSVNGGLDWGPATLLVNLPAFSNPDPALALDGTTAVLAWMDARHGPPGDIAYRKSGDAGASWESLQFLVRAETSERTPSVALDGNAVLVAWADMRSGSSDLAFRRSSDRGASFGPLEFLARAPSHDLQPVIRVNGSDALLAWVDLRGGNRSISFRHSPDAGVTWAAASRLVAAPTDEVGPACDLAAGLARCAWTDRRTGMPRPMQRDSTSGGSSWLPLRPLD